MTIVGILSAVDSVGLTLRYRSRVRSVKYGKITTYQFSAALCVINTHHGIEPIEQSLASAAHSGWMAANHHVVRLLSTFPREPAMDEPIWPVEAHD